MELILLKDVDKLGYKHDVVKVKNGYGQNFLIPKGFAVLANKSNMAKLNELKRQDDRRESKRLDEYKVTAVKLNDASLKIAAKAGTSGKIFGSVTNVQIVQALKEQLQLEIERRKISLNEDVKTLGSYTANVNLHPEVQATIKFEVEAD